MAKQKDNKNGKNNIQSKNGSALMSLKKIRKEQGAEKKRNKEPFLERLTRISLVDKLFFTQHLGVMIRTGIPLSRALESLSSQTPNKRFRKVLDNIHNNIEAGNTLSDGLSEYPHVFSELFISMIAAGETSGKLEDVLKTLTIQMKKDHALIAKVRGALFYPIIVVIAMVAVGISTIVFVMPKLVLVYAESQAILPLPTRIMIAVSKFTSDYIIFIAIGSVLFVIVFLRVIATKRGKRVYHAFMLRMPIAGKIIKKINLARFNRILSSLLKTDVTITHTFEVIATTLGNVVYREFINQGVEKLKKGVSIAEILQENKRLFPPVIIQIISVGEETGALDEITEEVASFYEEEVDQVMGNLATIIEPILMIVLGLAVGAMAVAVIMPMYTLVDTM